MNRLYSNVLNKLYEGADVENLIVATYLVGAEKDEDPILKAASIAIEQTTGSWVDVPGETDEIREGYAGKTIGVYEVPDFELKMDLDKTVPEGGMRFYIMRIGFPVDNIDDNLPLFFATVTGNITAMPYLKLLDVDFPKNFVKKFKGPKFGIKGVRDLLGVYDRPLLNNMIKPCTGYTPEVGAKLFYDAAVGGVDIIKDDELIGGDRVFNKLEDRVKMNMAAAAKADAVKGEKTIYTVNITDEISRLKDNALRAIAAGANGIMVDVFGIGLSALRDLAEDPRINVPILAHCCFGGAQSVAKYQGVSSVVLTKLTRMCGADIILIEAPWGKFDNLENKYISRVIACTGKLYDMNTSVPFMGGGVIEGLIPTILDKTGNDCLLGVGAAIHGHPQGPEKGAVAFRQAIDAYMNGQDLEEAGREHEELGVALAKWGVFGKDNVKKNYLI